MSMFMIIVAKKSVYSVNISIRTTDIIDKRWMTLNYQLSPIKRGTSLLPDRGQSIGG